MVATASYNYGITYNNYENYYDPDKSIKMWGLSLGWGKRLKWPDDYFTLSAELAYQRYNLKDWQYFPVTNGKCNDLSLSLTLARNSIDNPIFPRTGSDFSLSVQLISLRTHCLMVKTIKVISTIPNRRQGHHPG